ncbi:MAG TPA: hypothetical protein DER23_08370 [Clostridiales bacterium]|jgi:heme/copper-type cytochrome/quinol oxidase subunit 3|nr:hypothetical protein [Clostridiales bacterium]HCG36342.1 hypothetical protein [Clostridiales bacterium]
MENENTRLSKTVKKTLLSTSMAVENQAAHIEEETLATTAGTSEIPSWLEDMSISGKLYLLSMGIIFACLIAVFMILKACGRITILCGNQAEGKVAPATEINPVLHREPECMDDTALIAVITAAIAAARGSDNQSGGFRVVALKRTGKRL